MNREPGEQKTSNSTVKIVNSSDWLDSATPSLFPRTTLELIQGQTISNNMLYQEALQIHILYPRTEPLAVVFLHALKSFSPKWDTDIELFQDVSTQPHNKGSRQHWRTDL